MRLVGGSTPQEGRVEVLHDNVWGTVCDDEWDDIDARVVCSSLGLTGGIALTDNEFGAGTGQIWLDDVECTGRDTSLEQCRHRPWGENNCGHHEDAGVRCVGR